MSAALAFAVWLFSSLPVEEHGICRVYSVQPEPALPNHWWACGSCYWEGRFLLAAALIHCTKRGECEWVKAVPENANLGVCERARP